MKTINKVFILTWTLTMIYFLCFATARASEIDMVEDAVTDYILDSGICDHYKTWQEVEACEERERYSETSNETRKDFRELEL